MGEAEALREWESVCHGWRYRHHERVKGVELEVAGQRCWKCRWCGQILVAPPAPSQEPDPHE